MASSPVRVQQRKALEDPLAYLPCSAVLECERGQILYGYDQRCENLYVILSGQIKITRMADHGEQMLIDIYRTDEFFGESSLLNQPDTPEQALAYRKAKVMAWPTAEIEALIMQRPQLAVALLQTFGGRSLELTRRIENLLVDMVERRLARALIHFSSRLGTPQPDGGVLMEALTHELLGQYVGTSRETVSYHMINLRRLGYLKYSRKSILLYPDALNAWLESEPGT